MSGYSVGNEQRHEGSIVFSQAAATKVASLIQEENNDALNLRVFVSGGGCSGFQYGFTFDEAINEDDFVVETAVDNYHRPIRLLIDATSHQYLEAATIDYREDLQGEQFVINNPHAKTTCGCGMSFSTEDDDDYLNDEDTTTN